MSNFVGNVTIDEDGKFTISGYIIGDTIEFGARGFSNTDFFTTGKTKPITIAAGLNDLGDIPVRIINTTSNTNNPIPLEEE